MFPAFFPDKQNYFRFVACGEFSVLQTLSSGSANNKRIKIPPFRFPWKRKTLFAFEFKFNRSNRHQAIMFIFFSFCTRQDGTKAPLAYKFKVKAAKLKGHEKAKVTTAKTARNCTGFQGYPRTRLF